MDPKFFPVIIAMAFAFSGCLGIGDDDELDSDETRQGALPGDSDDGARDQEGGGDADDEGSGEPGPPTDPPSLSARLQANLSTGSFPLTVSFTLDGEHPEDPAPTWTLDPGDGGTVETGSDLPFELNHTYLEAGNFTAVFMLTVEDGSANDDLTITVQEPDIVAPAPNPPQSGANTVCLDYLLLWALNEEPGPGGVHSPLDDALDVDPGTGYTTVSSDGVPAVDFYDADGFYVTTGGDSGTVPTNAAYAIACVGVLGAWPEPPMPLGEFTYQDGF